MHTSALLCLSARAPYDGGMRCYGSTCVKLQDHIVHARGLIKPIAVHRGVKLNEWQNQRCLHDSVRGAAATFRNCPVDVFFWHLDGAAFAVNTVLRVNDQVTAVIVFVHLGRAEVLFRPTEDWQRLVVRYVGLVLFHTEVSWLVALTKTVNATKSISKRTQRNIAAIAAIADGGLGVRT